VTTEVRGLMAEGRNIKTIEIDSRDWYLSHGTSPKMFRKACEYLVFLWKLCNFAIVIEKTRKWVKILF
jgi:hypothetical protein